MTHDELTAAVRKACPGRDSSVWRHCSRYIDDDGKPCDYEVWDILIRGVNGTGYEFQSRYGKASAQAAYEEFLAWRDSLDRPNPCGFSDVEIAGPSNRQAEVTTAEAGIHRQLDESGPCGVESVDPPLGADPQALEAMHGGMLA